MGMVLGSRSGTEKKRQKNSVEEEEATSRAGGGERERHKLGKAQRKGSS